MFLLLPLLSLASPPTTAADLDAFRSPPAAYAWYLRARVAEALQDRSEADRSMAWVTRLDRPTAAAWAEAGDYEARAKRPAKALERFLSGLQRDASHPGCLEGAASAWLALGDEREAHLLLSQLRAPPWPLQLQLSFQEGDSQATRGLLDRWFTVDVSSPERQERSDWALRLHERELARADLHILATHTTFGPAACAALDYHQLDRGTLCADR